MFFNLSTDFDLTNSLLILLFLIFFVLSFLSIKFIISSFSNSFSFIFSFSYSIKSFKLFALFISSFIMLSWLIIGSKLGSLKSLSVIKLLSLFFLFFIIFFCFLTFLFFSLFIILEYIFGFFSNLGSSNSFFNSLLILNLIL